MICGSALSACGPKRMLASHPATNQMPTSPQTANPSDIARNARDLRDLHIGRDVSGGGNCSGAEDGLARRMEVGPVASSLIVAPGRVGQQQHIAVSRFLA